MDHDALVDLLLESATLKRMPRAGWLLRGVPHVESVAEHSFGVAFLALALVDLLVTGDETPEPLDLEKVLVLALLHDAGEVRLTDLPSSARGLIPDEVKRQAELQAIGDLLEPLPGVARWRALWQEFEDSASPEGRLVRDADKLEMMVQCLRYEQAGSRGLHEFWQAMDRRAWHYPLCGELYEMLKARRSAREEG
jgi:putative hydrolase of HD superfamily